MKKNKVLLPFLFIMFTLIYLFVIPGLVEGVNSIPWKTLHRVPEVNSKVKIDGVLNEKVWQEAMVLALNYEVEPGENIAPLVKTEVLLACSTNYLYAAFRAYDPNPSEIRARLTDRDNIRNDDYVGLVLDTFNDSRRTYNFYCNPFGVQAEKIINAQGVESSWDTIWNSAGKINKEGYIVEMAIPFSSLRFQHKKGDQVWGIDAVRNYPRSLEHVIGLFPRDRSNNCYMCQADKVSGFTGAKPGKNLEFDPTFSTLLTQERERFPEGRFVKKTGKLDPGVTVRWTFTPNLTLSAAINPDFSHVEADAAQLDINTQFALYYPEKRPFFLEGSSIFLNRNNLIYTRTLADPNWGIKLTGKEGAHAIGFFSVQDNITNFIFPGNQVSQSTSLDTNNQATVLRYRWDLGKSSNLGVVITDREGENYYNRLASIDGDIKITRKDQIRFQAIASHTHYPDHIALEYDQPLGNFKGTGFSCIYSHDTRNLSWYVDYQFSSPQFRSDLGFVTQVDFRFYNVGLNYTWQRNPGYWYTRLNIRTIAQLEKDNNNNLIQKNVSFLFNYAGPVQSFLNLYLHIGERKFMGGHFIENFLNFNTGFRPSSALFFTIKGALGDQIDYANGRGGKRFMVNPILEYNLGRHLSMGFDHVFERLKIDSGRLYTANLSNLRLVYQFNRRTFLRAILQYVHYDYNSKLYTFEIDPKFKHFFSQILFSYKINPHTVLFLGYSDDYYGYRDIRLTQKNRTFFLKIGYALVI
jgi:hypothetical protein